MKLIKLDGFYINADEISVFRASPKVPSKTLVWFRGGAMGAGDWEFTIDSEALASLLGGYRLPSTAVSNAE